MAVPDLGPLLRGLPSLAGPLPSFDPDVAPAEPTELFATWLTEAIGAGVREPHAMTLSTVDSDGRPSARVLILKNVDADGWQFATRMGGRKGRELSATPWAALTFYWTELGRQVRVRGSVCWADAEESARDFLARSAGARAVALLGRQSEPLVDRRELDLAVEQAAERVARQPDLVTRDWALCTVRADEVEFWQGHEQRRHTRLRYLLTEDGWRKDMLWP